MNHRHPTTTPEGFRLIPTLPAAFNLRRLLRYIEQLKRHPAAVRWLRAQRRRVGVGMKEGNDRRFLRYVERVHGRPEKVRLMRQRRRLAIRENKASAKRAA